jgi:hypothetical protein
MTLLIGKSIYTMYIHLNPNNGKTDESYDNTD